jgi:hypothetical protein
MKQLLLKSILIQLISVFFVANIFAADEPAVEKLEAKKWYETIQLSGMLRLRPEVKINTGFETGRAHESEFVGQKLWFTVGAKPLDNLKFVLTFQDSRYWGGEDGSSTGLSTNFLNTGFREAFLNFGALPDDKLNIIGGRQKLMFGDQRLFGALEWSNVGRSFDALRVNWNEKNNNLNVWSSILQEGSVETLNMNSGDPEMLFNGVYNSTNIGDFLLLDVLYANKLNLTDSYTLKHHTLGGRITNRTEKGKTANNFPLDFTLDGAYQFGTKDHRDVSAYAAAAQLGFTINPGFKIRFGIEGDIASGDTDPADDKFETFDNLFPTNHAFYGMADIISWQNMIGASANISLMFSKEFNLILAYWYFQRLEDTDSWYGVAGGTSNNNTWITGTSGMSTLKELAHEIDVTVKSEISKHFELEAGYAIVVAGEAVQDSGKNDPIHFTYVSATGKF